MHDSVLEMVGVVYDSCADYLLWKKSDRNRFWLLYIAEPNNSLVVGQPQTAPIKRSNVLEWRQESDAPFPW